MADQEPHEADAHEAVHLPPPSIWPVVLAVGIALFLTGLILNLVMVIAGTVIIVASIAIWIRDARRQIGELPE